MLARFFNHFQFCIYLVNESEFFPVVVRSIGMGVTGICGSIGMIITQILFVNTQELGVNPFIIISMMYFILFILYFWVSETLGEKPRDQIQEVEEQIYQAA